VGQKLSRHRNLHAIAFGLGNRSISMSKSIAEHASIPELLDQGVAIHHDQVVDAIDQGIGGWHARTAIGHLVQHFSSHSEGSNSAAAFWRMAV
jgi:hypothetical protein